MPAPIFPLGCPFSSVLSILEAPIRVLELRGGLPEASSLLVYSEDGSLRKGTDLTRAMTCGRLRAAEFLEGRGMPIIYWRTTDNCPQ